MARDQTRVGLSEFIADPQSSPLETPSGLIEVSSSAYAKTGFPAVPQCRIYQPQSGYPLRLITPHSRYRVNSQNSNIDWFRRLEQQQLWINPQDAEARGMHAPADPQ